MKSQKLTFIAAAIGVLAIAAIACGSEPVASNQSGDTAPAGGTENVIPVEPDNGIGDGAAPIIDDNQGIGTPATTPDASQPTDGVINTDDLQPPGSKDSDDNRGIAVGEPNPATPDEDMPINPDADRDDEDIDEIVIEVPEDELVDVALAEILCITTLAVQMPIEFHFGSDPVLTSFHDVNGGSCTFPEEIESITVTLYGIDGSGPSHTAIWTLPVASNQVSFPLPKDLIAMETRAFLGAGQYERTLTAKGTSRAYYDVANASGALMVVTILAPEEPESPTEAPVVAPPLCMTTLAVQAPIEFFYGSGPVPTGFDGVNGASCTFREEIERVEVTLTAIESGHVHSENFQLAEATVQVSFPLPEDTLTFGTLDMLESGKYERVITAYGVNGGEYNVNKRGALSEVTILEPAA